MHRRKRQWKRLDRCIQYTKDPCHISGQQKLMEFLIFRYTFLPFATALIIVAKLSSVKIMAAASLETSVPAFPIAIPMSAFFKAGASFTPSPVIAVMCPFFCHASTMRILCSGDTLAYTESFPVFPAAADRHLIQILLL